MDSSRKDKVLNKNYNPTTTAPVKGLYTNERNEKLPFKVRFWFNVGPTNEAVAAESCKPFI
jgi:hypothetical protein